MLWASALAAPAAVLNLDWALKGAEALGRFAWTSVVGRLVAAPLVFLDVSQEAELLDWDAEKYRQSLNAASL